MFVFLLSIFLACQNSFSQDLSIGTWIENDYYFTNDTCSLEAAFSGINDLPYNFGSPLAEDISVEDITGDLYDNTPQDLLIENQHNLWRLCESYNGAPLFDCNFSTLLMHFEQWKDKLSIYTESLSTNCEFSVSGNTEGLFINEEMIFIVGDFSAECYGEENPINECSSNFSSIWTKQ